MPPSSSSRVFHSVDSLEIVQISPVANRALNGRKDFKRWRRSVGTRCSLAIGDSGAKVEMFDIEREGDLPLEPGAPAGAYGSLSQSPADVYCSFSRRTR